MFAILARLLSDAEIEKRYLKAGTEFGDAVSYLYMGECVGFRSLFKRWQRWEALYAQRGYRTLPIDCFCAWGGYGVPLVNFGVRRMEGEQKVLHASLYEHTYLGKIRPALNVARLMSGTDGAEEGTYTLPSTKNAE